MPSIRHFFSRTQSGPTGTFVHAPNRTSFALSYGLSFAAITSTVVHTLLYYRHQIWHHAGRSLRERPDVHAQLMSKYKQGE